ncbi:aldehyde dehydrogenase family-domain-containing protein [Aspergillus keveii]|uniref:Aldehyde dehydrogenase family-domain-containing protein n=1 Tax=Aspergillus keveii TaxID=714993 RepID=A0ABR4FX16_9EURO
MPIYSCLHSIVDLDSQFCARSWLQEHWPNRTGEAQHLKGDAAFVHVFDSLLAYSMAAVGVGKRVVTDEILKRRPAVEGGDKTLPDCVAIAKGGHFGNAPWPLGCRAVSYALAAGNTVVLKGSELSPRCYWAIGDIFRQAGLPDGCLNLVIHRPQDAAEITNVLIAHPSIKKINFTGSTAVGAIISSLAGKHLKPVITELGGKASAIILKDADVEKAAEACTLGSFLHAGQVCMSTERIIVHSSLAESFIKAFKKFTEAIFPTSGQPPVFVSQLGARKTKTLVSAALESGASVVFGDMTETSSSTTTMRPVALRDVPKNADLYYTESFGPTVTIFTFESEEEALAIANDTEYGLAGAVFTEDLTAGLRVARQYETGNIHINAMSIHDDVNVPHGGVKKSGFGRLSGTPGIEEYLTTRVVTWQTRS